jgi:hypothetical protein
MMTGSQTAPEERVFGKKNQLVGMYELRTFVLIYNDGSGERAHPHPVHYNPADGKFYSAPNAIEWGKSLRELQPWLQEAAKKQFKIMEQPPSEQPDNVEIMEEKAGS